MSEYYPCRSCGQPMGAPGDEGCPWPSLRLQDGSEVARVLYGAQDADQGAAEGKPCHDCAVEPGRHHHLGCDAEPCGRCGGQLIACDCPYSDS